MLSRLRGGADSVTNVSAAMHRHKGSLKLATGNKKIVEGTARGLRGIDYLPKASSYMCACIWISFCSKNIVVSR